ncbi:MAG: phosphatase PAP2 family protein [Chitinophagaceae bacterium]|nr:MAG: phosphatase PAP2 family protein [Chitinophagaceae bacterium]
MGYSQHGIGLFLLLSFLGSMVIFVILFSAVVFAVRPGIRKYKPVDLSVFEKLQPYITARNNRLMELLTFFGKHVFLIPANLVLIFYFLLVRHNGWNSIRAAAISTSSLGLMFVLKFLFHRKRPVLPLLRPARGLSFPSGHAIMSVSFFGFLGSLVNESGCPPIVKMLVIGTLLIFILLIGFSRVYLRVHYASDVIVGFIVGVAWLLVCQSVLDAAKPMLN